MDQNKQHKLEFQITLNDELTNEEIKTLKRTTTMYGIAHAEYFSFSIIIQSDEDTNVFSVIPTWLDTIGASEDIFSVQKIETFYTGFVSDKIKDLMRT